MQHHAAACHSLSSQWLPVRNVGGGGREGGRKKYDTPFSDVDDVIKR